MSEGISREPAPFGALLRRYRAAAHLTQEQLAARAGLSPDAIAALERGKRHTPRGATVELLAAALGLNEDERAQFVSAARASLAAPSSGPTGVIASSIPTATPASAWLAIAQPTPLVDRRDELDVIYRRLTVEGARLLTLTGPAGVGKTRLALAVVSRLADQLPERFADGIVVVDLSPVRDPEQALGAIARGLGLLDVGSRPVLERLVEVLAERHVLMALDNFEQVLPAGTFLADLLAHCTGLSLLVTSRTPLQLRWEQTLRVAPLPVPDLAAPLPPLEELVAIPSIALFVQRVRAHQGNFILGEKEVTVVAHLAAQLDGLPLALELAAASAATLSLPAIAHRLGDRLRLLRWEAPDAPARQHSLEAAVGWSYDLLGEAEQRVFRCLGVFVGRVSLDAIAAVGGAVTHAVANGAGGMDTWRMLDYLASLGEKSLVLPAHSAVLGWQQGGSEDADESADEEDAEPAFRMLETVRAYAEERLAATGELATARQAHAHYFQSLAERADPELHRRDQRAWLFQLEREHDNLRAALRWLLDQEDPAERERALRLAGALGEFWVVRGYNAEGGRWLEEALARTSQREEGTAVDPAAHMQAALEAGVLLTNRGDIGRAREYLQEALALARQLQDLSPITKALTWLGACALFTGQAEEAVRLLEEGLRRARTLGDPHHIGVALFFLGGAAMARADTDVAVAYYAEAVNLHESAGDIRTAAGTHIGLGTILSQRGDLSGAAQHIRAGLEVSARLRDRRFLGYGVRAVLDIVGDRGNPIARARLLGAADLLFQATGAGRAPWGPVAPDRRAPLTEEEWEAAYREGRTLSLGKVVRLALRLLDEVATSTLPSEPRSAMPEPISGSAALSAENRLSAREQEVLRLVAQGLTSKEIGERLFLSPSTVNHYPQSIFNKLGVDTRAQAVAVAAQQKLL